MEQEICTPAATAGPIRLSVLVPVYNVAPYLEECLHSILTQIERRADVELVLLDDKSTDGSDALCRRLVAGRERQVRVLAHATNRGLSAARNTMMDDARGEYLWFVDSDDMLLPGAVDRLLAILDAEQPDIVMCDYMRSRRRRRYPTFAGPERSLQTCPQALITGVFAKKRLHMWSKICRRDLFGDIRFPEGACFEDVATVPWLLLKARSYHYAAEPWIYYRTRPDSIMALINKARTGFDRRGNDDLARALAGFGPAMVAAIPDLRMGTRLAVARFLAREFAKIGKRLLRAGNGTMARHSLHAEIHRYRVMMEACSPTPFTHVARSNLMRGRIGRGLEIWFWMAFAARQAKAADVAAGSRQVSLDGI